MDAKPYELPCNPPEYLRRSEVALFSSVVRLIDLYSPCYMWTVTSPDICSDSAFARRHSAFIENLRVQSRLGRIPYNFGGVRVFEHHPKREGHPLHSHLVARGRMEFAIVRDCARRAGLGNIFRRPKPCDLGSAHYLVKYLIKGDKLFDIKAWSCFGTYDGYTANNIEFDSERIRRIRYLKTFYIENEGMKPYPAYLRACRTVGKEKGKGI